jgi:membrane protein DedA with SNARE-associated domain
MSDAENPAAQAEVSSSPVWHQSERMDQLPRWLVRLAILIAAVSLVGTWAGSLLAPQFVDNNPRLLIALNPRNSNLVLVSNQISDLAYYSIGFMRLVFSDPFNYLLGLYFGERAFAWVERRSRSYGPFVRDAERLFRRFSHAVVFFAPNNIICILAGATGMRARWFFILNFAGTLVRLILIKRFGAVFEGPIDQILDLIARYRTPLLIVSALAVAWTIFGEFRGDNSELKVLRELDQSIRDDDDEQ